MYLDGSHLKGSYFSNAKLDLLNIYSAVSCSVGEYTLKDFIQNTVYSKQSVKQFHRKEMLNRIHLTLGGRHDV